jgi:indoleamine 2,3-dioxygenase
MLSENVAIARSVDQSRNEQEVAGVLEATPERGFLPINDPVVGLPAAFEPWEQIAGQLPKLLVADRLRAELDQLPVLDVLQCRREEDLHRAMLLLSYMGHAYVWGEEKPAARLPAGVAVPWHAVAGQLGRPPVLSYASYALYNWRRLDPAGPIALGNIVLLQNFLAGMDEEWFVLVHVDIEAKAAVALRAIPRAQAAVADDRPADLHTALADVAAALESMYATMSRMPEKCDPYIYFHRVRPYLYGWKDQPALPQGLVYEGVEEYARKPQKFRGETGAQSSIIPTLDALLGVSHASDPLRSYLSEMRQYMPPRHRQWIEKVEQGPAVRPYVSQRRLSEPALRDVYNACVDYVEKFRSMHLQYAAQYIQRQSQHGSANPNSVGTGGTPFMPYLKKHRDETGVNRIS